MSLKDLTIGDNVYDALDRLRDEYQLDHFRRNAQLAAEANERLNALPINDHSRHAEMALSNGRVEVIYRGICLYRDGLESALVRQRIPNSSHLTQEKFVEAGVAVRFEYRVQDNRYLFTVVLLAEANGNGNGNGNGAH